MVEEHDYDLHLLEDKEHICKDCLNFKDFKEKCWYHWEQKSECSQKIKL
jgi:hypothetical protein